MTGLNPDTSALSIRGTQHPRSIFKRSIEEQLREVLRFFPQSEEEPLFRFSINRMMRGETYGRGESWFLYSSEYLEIERDSKRVGLRRSMRRGGNTAKAGKCFQETACVLMRFSQKADRKKPLAQKDKFKMLFSDCQDFDGFINGVETQITENKEVAK